jgi:hypothetical protein
MLLSTILISFLYGTFHMKLLTLLHVVTMSVAISACGGGGSGGGGDVALASSPATAADKFVGSWGDTCVPSTNGGANGILSARPVFVYTKTGANSLNLSIDALGFAAANCAGVASKTVVGASTAAITLNGTKQIGTQTVDRLDLVAKSTTNPLFNGNFKEIALITGTTLTLSAASTPDSNGYPSALAIRGLVKL